MTDKKTEGQLRDEGRIRIALATYRFLTVLFQGGMNEISNAPRDLAIIHVEGRDDHVGEKLGLGIVKAWVVSETFEPVVEGEAIPEIIFTFRRDS